MKNTSSFFLSFVFIFFSLLLLFVSVGFGNDDHSHEQDGNVIEIEYVVKPSSVPSSLYPTWAHYHWVWFTSSYANQTREIGLVKDYLTRGIPVGALDVDSAWSTCTNNFEVDTTKYPNMSLLIDSVHEMNARVIFWATSLVDTNCDTYSTGEDNHYYLRGADGVNKVKWWHGVGSFIDYTNPYALSWWHDQLDNLISIGADGWKCDGTDPFVFEMGIGLGYQDQLVTEREYANSYYRDFWNYTRSTNPEALIMSRPVDSFEELYISFSPRDVVFSGWVGDQDPDFSGLRDALRNMFHSAWRNYVGFGSDIGGYRGSSIQPPLGRTQETFLRWAQMGSFCSLMENGGDGEHRPWIFDQVLGTGNQTLDIYRNYAFIHQSLTSYLLSTGMDAWEGNYSMMTPISFPTDFEPVSWDYWLGSDIFVCPIVEEMNQTNTRFIDFPEGNNYVDWWNSAAIYEGGTYTLFDSTNLTTFPVYHRQGSILPIEDVVVGEDHNTLSDSLTFLVFHPTWKSSSWKNKGEEKGGGEEDIREEAITVRRWKEASQEVRYQYQHSAGKFILSTSAHSRKMSFRILGISKKPTFLNAIPLSVTELSEDPELIRDDFRMSLKNPAPVFMGDAMSYLHVPESAIEGLSWYWNSEKKELDLIITGTPRGMILEVENLI